MGRGTRREANRRGEEGRVKKKKEVKGGEHNTSH